MPELASQTSAPIAPATPAVTEAPKPAAPAQAKPPVAKPTPRPATKPAAKAAPKGKAASKPAAKGKPDAKKQPAKADTKPVGIAKRLREEFGILEPQLRILKALAKAKNGLDKAGLVEKAGVHANWVVEFIGSANMVSEDVRGVKKLIPAKLVERETIDVDKKTEYRYIITDRGQKLLTKIG